MKLKGYVIQNDGKFKRAVYGSPSALGTLSGGVGENATEEEKLAAYDKLGGLIKTKNDRKIKTGCFWDFKKNVIIEKPKPVVEIRVDGEVFEYQEGEETPLEVRAKETIDKKKREKRAKEVAVKKKKREEKQAKVKK